MTGDPSISAYGGTYAYDGDEEEILIANDTLPSLPTHDLDSEDSSISAYEGIYSYDGDEEEIDANRLGAEKGTNLDTLSSLSKNYLESEDESIGSSYYINCDEEREKFELGALEEEEANFLGAYASDCDEDIIPITNENTIPSPQKHTNRVQIRTDMDKRSVDNFSPPDPSALVPLGDDENVKNWNKEFQNILNMKDGREKYVKLQELGQDFVYAAKTYGKIIISEIKLPVKDKTIRPKNPGGIAGGTKFQCQSIFFKLVTDTRLPHLDPATCRYMYGDKESDDSAAIKAAGLELQGLISFYNVVDYEDVRFPLMALIDYRGYRLIALSILPIGGNSIIYGSADAGKTVHDSNPQFNRAMLSLGEKLNLRTHIVGGKNMATCGDIEGHKGSDDNFYLLDFARVFPPEAPPKQGSVGRVVFYRHLRPEFVRSFTLPLSSDAYSGWQSKDPQSPYMNGEVRLATEHLYNEVIPTFSQRLDHIADMVITEKTWSVTQELHRHGINVRHCGRVRSFCNSVESEAILATEMTARVLKDLVNESLRETMKESKLPLRVPFRSAVVSCINRFISWEGSHCSDASQVNGLVLNKFPFGLTSLERSGGDIRFVVIPKIFFRRFQTLTAITISKQYLEELEGATSLLDIPFTLIPSDIMAVGARVKHLNVIDEAEAKVLSFEASNASGSRAEQLWRVVHKKYEAALSSNTSSYYTLTGWASSLLQQAQQQLDHKISFSILDSAFAKANTAISTRIENYQAKYIHAQIELERGTRTSDGTETQASLLSKVVVLLVKLLNEKPTYYSIILRAARKKFQQALDPNYYVDLKRIAFLASAIMYRSLLVVSQRSEASQVMYECCMAMFEYIAEASKLGRSGPLHFTALEVGQGLNSFFLHSKQLSLEDNSLCYTINKEKSDLPNNRFSVHTTPKEGAHKDRNFLPIVIQYDKTRILFLRLIKISTPIQNLPLTKYQALFAKANTRNAIHLPNDIVHINLKYEPMDWFELTEMTIDFSEIPLENLPASVALYVFSHAADLIDAVETIKSRGIAPTVLFMPQAERQDMLKKRKHKSKDNHFLLRESINKSKTPKAFGSALLLIIAPPGGSGRTSDTKMMIQNISFVGKHRLTGHAGRLEKTANLLPGRGKKKMSQLMLELITKSNSNENDLKTNALEYNLLQATFDKQGYKLATLIQMGTVCPILRALTRAHLLYANKATLDEDMGSMCSFGNLGNYNSINISDCASVTDDVVSGISHSKLHSLDISYNSSITDDAINRLALVANESLTALNVEGCEQLTRESIRHIVKHCLSLRYLSMWSSADAQTLCLLPKLSMLQSLSLCGCSNTSTKLFKSLIHSCTELKKLDLTQCSVSDQDLRLISKMPLLDNLILDSCKKITDKGIASLQNTPQLTRLSVHSVHVSDEPLVEFVLERALHIDCLSLRECGSISNILITTIAHHCKNITKLDCSRIQSLNDSSFYFIAFHCRKLNFLDASGTLISDESLRVLCERACGLKELYLDECKNITNSSLHNLYNLTQLKIFSISRNHLAQYNILQVISNVKSLEKLNISHCPTLSDITIMKAKSLNPSLVVVHHFASQ